MDLRRQMKADGARVQIVMALAAAACGSRVDEVAGAARGELSQSPVRELVGHTDGVHGVAFAPDGRSLATSSASGTIRIWDTLLGLELLTLKGRGVQVNGLAFSPDGRTLVSCAHDGSVHIWRSLADDPYTP